MKNAATVEVATRDVDGVRILKEEKIVADAFAQLATPGAIHSSVGFSIGTQHDFGRLKITANVNVTCDQNTIVMNEAGQLAFMKAMEFLQDGLHVLVEEEKAKK